MEATKEKGYTRQSKRSIGVSVMNSHKGKLSSVSPSIRQLYGFSHLRRISPHHSLEAQRLSWMVLPSSTQSLILQKMDYSQIPGSKSHAPQQLNFVLVEEVSVWFFENLFSNHNSASYNLGDLEYIPYPL